MQVILELDIVSGSGVRHGTPDFDALSERSNYRGESQSTVAGPPSCASVALRRRLVQNMQALSERRDEILFLPSNTRHSPNATSKPRHRLRRWPNIGTPLANASCLLGRSV